MFYSKLLFLFYIYIYIYIYKIAVNSKWCTGTEIYRSVDQTGITFGRGGVRGAPPPHPPITPPKKSIIHAYVKLIQLLT